MLAKIPVAFAAGLISVVTPCVLPLVPGYLSAISAVEAHRLGQRHVTRRVVVASLPFILGFTVVFVVLGAAAAAIGGVVNGDRQLEIAGFILVVLGLVFMGLLPWPERVVAPGLLLRARGAGATASGFVRDNGVIAGSSRWLTCPSTLRRSIGTSRTGRRCSASRRSTWTAPTK